MQNNKKFLKLDEDNIRANFNRCSYRELTAFAKFIDPLLTNQFNIKQIHSVRKFDLVEKLVTIASTTLFVETIYNKLSSTKSAKYIYGELIWEREFLDTQEIIQEFNLNITSEGSNRYGIKTTKQSGLLTFVQREEANYYNETYDILTLDGNIKSVLKMFYPVPSGSELIVVEDEESLDSGYTYSNENEIFNFINVISDMLKNNLVAFGKTNEKPLAKTLNILKSASGLQEFYDDKKMSLLATDMLTRSFSYYYWSIKGFKTKEIDVLRNFVATQFEDKMDFFITRIFVSHLKKIRYDGWYTNQSKLFKTLQLIMTNMPKDGWVDMSNILKYCKYKDIRIDLESEHKTREYYMESEIIEDDETIQERIYCEKMYYNPLFLEPILKASFFYLGALGLLELKYDEPYSSYRLCAKGKSYISTWDSLEFVKLSELGKYIFGFTKTYEQKEIIKKTEAIKFDEYKPLITIDKNDTIMQAKLDAYCEKQDTNRYILSYAKIFKDCKNSKALNLKIDSFYKQIEKNPPKVFKDFFDEIKRNSDLLKRDLKQVVIELPDNKKLLNIFMQNRRLQDLTIKAQGFRIIVLKENIPKVTKILKDKGFFIEF